MNYSVRNTPTQDYERPRHNLAVDKCYQVYELTFHIYGILCRTIIDIVMYKVNNLMEAVVFEH